VEVEVKEEVMVGEWRERRAGREGRRGRGGRGGRGGQKGPILDSKKDWEVEEEVVVEEEGEVNQKSEPGLEATTSSLFFSSTRNEAGAPHCHSLPPPPPPFIFSSPPLRICEGSWRSEAAKEEEARRARGREG